MATDHDAPDEPNEGRPPLTLVEAERRLAAALARHFQLEVTEDGLVWHADRDDHSDGGPQR